MKKKIVLYVEFDQTINDNEATTICNHLADTIIDHIDEDDLNIIAFDVEDCPWDNADD